MVEKNSIMLEIEKFVSGKMRIANHRIYGRKKDGGLELFKIEDFLGAQCCMWIKRAFGLNKLWKVELFTKANCSLFNLRPSDLDKNLNPVLHNMAGYFQNFVYEFGTKNENFRKKFFLKILQ